jgi:copper chaperone
MTKTLNLSIGNMHCGGCVNRVTAALKKLEGVEVQRVEVGSAEITLDDSVTTPDAVMESIRNIGFAPREA